MGLTNIHPMHEEPLWDSDSECRKDGRRLQLTTDTTENEEEEKT